MKIQHLIPAVFILAAVLPVFNRLNAQVSGYRYYSLTGLPKQALASRFTGDYSGLFQATSPGAVYGHSGPVKAGDEGSEALYGVIAGAGFGSLRYFRYGDSVKADTRPVKLFGVTLESPIKRAGENFWFGAELSLSQFKSEAYNPHYVPSASVDPETDYLELYKTFSPLNMHLMAVIKYTITTNRLRPYVYAGINNSFLLAAENFMEIIHHDTTAVNTTYDMAVPKRTIYGLSVIGGIGLEYKWIALEGRFDSGHNYTSQLYYTIYHPAIYALLRVKMYADE